MTDCNDNFRYEGPIFDSHAHVIDIDALDIYVRIGRKYGVEQSVLIVHGDDISQYQERYPDRFSFARYFSGWTLFTDGPDAAIQEVKDLRATGYSLAKMHFAPFWSDRLSNSERVSSVDSDVFDPLFDAFQDADIPVLIHIADPDTYFQSRYTNSEVYGTKEDHLQEFEDRLKKNKQLRFQAAHFAAQAEQHRLPNLERLFDTYPNLSVDTSSARWMARELSKDPDNARRFVGKYKARILFGTDCVARTLENDYYDGRHLTERLIFESNVRMRPLPFVDKDTVGKGGTYINGLCLPDGVLEKIYWENAFRLYCE